MRITLRPIVRISNFLRQISLRNLMIGLRSKEANLENLLQNVMKLGNGSLCLTVLATITRVILLLQGLDVHGEEKALAMETVDTRKELPLRNMMRFFPMDKSFPLNTSKTSMN